jgi:hypothetical protein
MAVEDNLFNFLLQENGDAILLETGDNLLLEQESVPGLPSVEILVITDPQNANFTYTEVGRITLPVGVENSMQVAVPPISSQILGVGVANTSFTVRLTDR